MEFSITTDAYDEGEPIGPRFCDFSEAGFSFIHWCDHWVSPKRYSEDETEDVLRLAERAGMVVQDIHSVCGVGDDADFPDDLWLALNINRLQFISTLGGDCIVLHLPKGGKTGKMVEDVLASKRLLDMLRPHADRYGVRAAIENLGDSDYALFDELLESYPADYIGFCFDSGHANIARQSDMVNRYANRLIALHLHDNDGTADQHNLPGNGTIDWPPIIRSIKSCGYRKPVNLEVHKPSDAEPRQWCKYAYETVKSLWHAV